MASDVKHPTWLPRILRVPPRALRQAYYADPNVRRLERRNESNPPAPGNRSESLRQSRGG